MKPNLTGLALATALLFAAPAARAEGTPIQGTSVGLEHDPQGIIANSVTDNHGYVSFRDLKPGNYILTIDGPSLVAAVDRLARAPEPEKKSGGSFSLGIGGGMFGGGGSHRSSPSSQGAGPISGSQTPSSHGGSHSSGGGMGFGMSVPVGGGDRDSNGSGGAPSVTFIIGANTDNGKGNISFETPYCRDAKGDVRIHFTVPNRSPGAAALSADSGGIETVVVTAQF